MGNGQWAMGNGQWARGNGQVIINNIKGLTTKQSRTPASHRIIALALVADTC
ncbi:MAG: hypothetical protein KME30_07545 [Iphinoe sp. HA4291-MV1]|nr:hypothetical protein [Iphinoe sp. HA4291-MV1]